MRAGKVGQRLKLLPLREACEEMKGEAEGWSDFPKLITSLSDWGAGGGREQTSWPWDGFLSLLAGCGGAQEERGSWKDPGGSGWRGQGGN